jgi:hypothetical protein
MMKATVFLSLTGVIAVFLLSGCATSQTPKMREDFRSIFYHYNTQAYDQCMAEIGKALQTKLLKGQRVVLLMTRGMCQEEMGRDLAAKATYTLVKTEFDMTTFAEGAQRRLEHKDGDQREHLELSFNETRWRRAAKQWDAKKVREFYFPIGENEKQHTAKLLLLSGDRPENVHSLDDAEARAEAQFSLRGGKVKRHLIEQSLNERYSEAEESSPKHPETSVCLSRIILTDTRFHCAAFTLRKPALAADERGKYLDLLKSAKLVGN